MDLRELKENKNAARHPWEIARLNVVDGLFKQHLPRLNQHFTLLDVGCGDTWFVEQMSVRYPNAKMAGVDIAFEPQLLAQLQQKFKNTNVNVFSSLELAKDFVGKKVDVVLLLDVIEHIEDDIAFLKWLQTFDFITDETVFVITVPAYQKLFCSHDVFLGHYRRYTNTMLLNHTNQANLNAIGLGYFFTSLLFPRIIQVLQEKVMVKNATHQTKGLADWQGQSVKNKIIATILFTDYKITNFLKKLGIKLPGLSNYVICKKFA